MVFPCSGSGTKKIPSQHKQHKQHKPHKFTSSRHPLEKGDVKEVLEMIEKLNVRLFDNEITAKGAVKEIIKEATTLCSMYKNNI